MSRVVISVGLWMLLCSGATAVAADFLPPDQAFRVSFEVQDPQCQADCLGQVNVQVAQGYYLYRDKFSLESGKTAGRLQFVGLPQGQKKFDENLNKEIEALRGDFSFQIRYDRPAALGATMTYQGCADAGLCYPPEKISLQLDSGNGVSRVFGRLFGGAVPSQIAGADAGLEVPNNQTDSGANFGNKVASDIQGSNSGSSDINTSGSGLGDGAAAVTGQIANKSGVDEAGRLASRLAGESWWIVLPLFFGMGLLLSFTPCTLPMLPILGGMVVGTRGKHGGGASESGKVAPLVLAGSYVLGMAITYAVLGAIAGLSGQSLVVALQQAPVLWTFGALIAALGFAMLMGYQIQLPSGLQSWVQSKSSSLTGGQALPVFVMGALSALLLGPCVAPPLAGALLYIGQSGDALLGGLALFVLALGMGLPLMAVVAGGARFVPKAGRWMEWVTAAFGFLLILTGLWIVSPVVSTPLLMAASAMVLMAMGVSLFVGVTELTAVRVKVFWGTFAGGLLLLSMFYALGAASGSREWLRPLGFEGSARSVADVSTAKVELVESKSIEQVLQSSTMPVMLDFYADWCVSCKEFENFTFPDSRVQQQLSGMRVLKVDVTHNTPEDQALLKKYRLFGPPALLFFPAGKTQDVGRVIGFESASRFSESVRRVRVDLSLPAV